MGNKKDIRVEYIQPGNPQKNAYIERANRTIRYSWVSKHLFENLQEVQEYVTKWLWFYNHERPHKASGGRPALMVAILYSQSLYLKLLPLLSIFEKELLCREVLPMQKTKSPSFDLAVFGLRGFGRAAVDDFKHKRLSRLGYLAFIVHDKGSGEHLKREGSVIMMTQEYAVQYATQKIF